MESIEQIKQIRKPTFKSISFENMDTNNEMYIAFKKNNLTRNDLLNSAENNFLVAFFYNELFDIKEYLKYLSETTITQQSYNVIKLYLKNIGNKNNTDFINSFFENSQNNRILKILKGEIYRIHKISIDNYDPYFFIGYCTIGDVFLDNFEDTFNLFIDHSADTIKVLKEFGFYSKTLINERLINITLKNLSNCINSILSEGILDLFIDYINFTVIDIELLCKICKNSQKQNELIEKLSNILDLETSLEVFIKLSDDFNMFLIYKNFVIQKLKILTEEFIEKNKKTVFDILNILYFYEPNNLFNIDNLNKSFDVLKEETDYKIIHKISGLDINNEIMNQIRPNDTFIETIQKFGIFSYFCTFNEPILNDQILELPEKFFNIALSSISTESAKNLKIFNDNPFNERLRKSIYTKIDRDIFIKYLIKRYKFFKDIDFLNEDSKYEKMMDDKYKVFYALYNLEWANKHIEELNEIGISDKLYFLLKNSTFKGCLTKINYQMNNDTIKEESNNNSNNSINSNKNSSNNSINSNASNNNSNININKNEIDIKQNYDLKMIQIETDENTKRLKNNVSEENGDQKSALQSIYNEFKNEERNFNKYLRNIKSKHEFYDILKTLFLWSKKRKDFLIFIEFFKISLQFFEVDFEEIYEVVLEITKKHKDIEIFKKLAVSLKIDQIPRFIDEFSEYINFIIEGLIIKIRKEQNTENFNKIVNLLIKSTSTSRILVGVKLYSLLKNPNFDLDDLLTNNNDNILLEVIINLKKPNNKRLLEILYQRGVIDQFSAEICKKLVISELAVQDKERIHSLFCLNPLNYIKYEISNSGFLLDEQISIDLIKSLATVYSESTFEMVSNALSTFQWTQQCFDQMVISLDHCNFLFKSWVFDNLNTKNITLPIFIKLCWFIGNENNMEILKKALLILKEGKVYDIIDSWAEMKKLDRLTIRIYPLRLNNIEIYKNKISTLKDEEELAVLNEVYDLKL